VLPSLLLLLMFHPQTEGNVVDGVPMLLLLLPLPLLLLLTIAEAMLGAGMALLDEMLLLMLLVLVVLLLLLLLLLLLPPTTILPPLFPGVLLPGEQPSLEF